MPLMRGRRPARARTASGGPTEVDQHSTRASQAPFYRLSRGGKMHVTVPNYAIEL
jgi:hypothetical protein